MSHIFTKFSNVVSGNDDSDSLKIELNDALAKLKAKEIADQNKDSILTRHESFLKQQQQDAEENKKKIAELQEQIARLNQNSNSTEFCCAQCSTIHSKQQCPTCSSKLKRIYEDNISE